MALPPSIGWIGAGRMGMPMAGLLLQAGYPLLVCTRTAANRERLMERGARAVASVAECARGADLVFSSLPDDEALRKVALGPEGVLANAKRGAIFVETSTVSAEISAQVALEATQRDVAYLRAPISGNAASAQRGEVTVLVSGPDAAWREAKPVLEAFSQAQVYLGAGEEARYMKLVANAIVINTAQAIAEALALGRKTGLDWGVMLDTLAQSTIASPWLKAKVHLLKPRDFTPTMTARLILKDIDLMLAAARASSVPMPLTAVTRQAMQELIDTGRGEEDYMATVKLSEERSGLPSDDA
jgi:3-hydroxyisobutyrate dehydrogenase-like beta-hydroxyacid dehydrogenase